MPMKAFNYICPRCGVVSKPIDKTTYFRLTDHEWVCKDCAGEEVKKQPILNGYIVQKENF